MELDYFKDTIFDLLNNSDEMDIKDIKTNDKENKFTISFPDGNHFELECRQIHKNTGKEHRTDGKKIQPL